MVVFDIIIFIMMGVFGFMMIFLLFAKKRMDNNEPIFGWKRKQFLQEQGDKGHKNHSKGSGMESIKDLIGIKDIRYGVFEKIRNEYCIIISTDSVNFDLLNESSRGSIILGYQSLFRVIRFTVQVIGQAVRQDLRKDEKRFLKNLEKANPQTKDYNMRVIQHIKDRSEKEFRISRRVYYVVSYQYQPSRMGKLTPDQKEKRILTELYMRGKTVAQMLRRARIETEILDSLSAMEVIKRALNRDRMLSSPIESVVEAGKEKFASFITADVTTLPGYEDLVQNIEEVRWDVRETQSQDEEKQRAVNE